MEQATSFYDTFNTIDSKIWYYAHHTINEAWIDTSFSPSYIKQGDGEVTLRLSDDDLNGKSYTGGEITTRKAFGYGRFEAELRASGESGVDTGFFLYTGPAHGTIWNEIDFEFLGKDTTKVLLSWHYDGQSSSEWVDLGFDAADGFHTYAIEWQDDSIRWFADDRLLLDVLDPGTPVPDVKSKIIFNAWAGYPSLLGPASFDETSVTVRSVSYEPLPAERPAPVVDPVKGSAGEPALRSSLIVSLIDSRTQEVIEVIDDGDVIELSAKQMKALNIIAAVADTSVREQSITLELSGPVSGSKVENYAPYALFGDDHGWFRSKALSAGTYEIDAAAFTQLDGLGTLLGAADLTFTVKEEGVPLPKQHAGAIEVLLVDASTDTVIARVEDGATLEVTAGQIDDLTLVARPTAGSNGAGRPGSIKFDLSGATTLAKVESGAPYALYGDSGGDLTAKGGLAAGSYALTTTAFTGAQAAGPVLDAASFAFSIVVAGGSKVPSAPPSVPSGLKLFLIDTKTDTIIEEIDGGDIIDVSVAQTKRLSILAEVASDADDFGTTESIRFDVSGALNKTKIESYTPYALFGDAGGNYFDGSMGLGKYSVTASAFSSDGAAGTLLAQVDVDFILV
ncbi:family 16 glycosylhydrolase [Acuticoccus sp.]|uniref:family 16 glycosylhydrolase n=1 Tax=Acuticoccus sp. TaxID=1904378 RepID=UPI003B52773F